MKLLMLILSVLFLFFFALSLVVALLVATTPLVAALVFGTLAALCLMYREGEA